MMVSSEAWLHFFPRITRSPELSSCSSRARHRSGSDVDASRDTTLDTTGIDVDASWGCRSDRSGGDVDVEQIKWKVT